MNQLTLAPIDSVSGDVRLPGSKSLSNRALLLAGLARGNTRLTNLLKSEDTQKMVAALNQFGVHLELNSDWTECTVTGNAGLFKPPTDNRFFMGNAGTAIRPLTAILALINGDWEIDGDDYMPVDTSTKYVIDRRWQVDSNGDIMPRNVMMFTSGSTVSYLED